ncbi:MAG TPA: hypothetical protein DIW24_05170 [Bacteroidetes bacterium]|nr:hypothetical protein [Bacteroidota bacterium]
MTQQIKKSFNGIIGGRWFREPWLWAALGLLSFWLLQVTHGLELRVTLHDTLDSDVAVRKILSETGGWYLWNRDAVLPMIMNGLPRNAIDLSGVNLINLLFVLFSPWTAFVLSMLLVHGVAGWGAYKLSGLFLEEWPVFRVLISWGFAFLPHYVLYGWTTAGLPWLIWATVSFLRYQAPTQQQFGKFASVWIGYAIGAHFILFGFFVWLGMVALVGWYAHTKRLMWKRMAVVTGVVLVLFMVQTSHLLMNMGDAGFVSHRTGWNLFFQHDNFVEIVKDAIFHFIAGQYHAPSIHTLVLVLLLASVWVFRRQHAIVRKISILLFVQAGFSFLGVCWFWEGLIPVKMQLGFLKSFNAGRLAFVSPVIWLAALMITTRIWLQQKPLAQPYLVVFLVIHVLWVGWGNGMLRSNIMAWLRPDYHDAAFPSWSGFYAPQDWAKVKANIGVSTRDFRVISVGIHPAVAQFNGFYTLDSYQNNYLLGYHAAFRRIVASELAMSDKWRRYFDEWGSRCYILPAHAQTWKSPFWVLKREVKSPKPLQLDHRAFKKMGGRFLIATYELDLSDVWQLRKRFETHQAWYNLYLYEVK